MNQSHLSPDTIILPGILNQLNFFIELTHLIEYAIKIRQPILVAIIRISHESDANQDELMDTMQLLLGNIAGMIKTRFNNGELIGFSHLTTEFSLAMEANQSDLVQTIEKHVDDIVIAMLDLTNKLHCRLSFSYALQIPDTTTFADNLIANARKDAHSIHGDLLGFFSAKFN